jgi:DNA mismatch repair protein MutS2
MWWLLATVLLLAALAALGRRFLDGARRVHEEPPSEPGGPDPDYEVHVGDELDLHGVPEREVGELVAAFVEDAVARRRPWVKIVHGKGTGRRRGHVRAILARHPAVRDAQDAASPGSGWGATIVHLRLGDPPGGPA